MLAVKNIAMRILKVHSSFSLVRTKGARHTVFMAYRSQADWDSVDWFDSDREIAAELGVSHSAVAKRRKKIGHASLYKVDAMFLRGWFEHNRRRLPGMTNRDIEVEVFDQLDLIGFDCSYWRRQMASTAHATKAKPESVAGVR